MSGLDRNATVISASGLTRRFGETVAVRELSFSVSRGEIFGFLGHNGAGKTTTVRLLNGVLAPSAGEMRVLDLSPVGEGPRLRRFTGVLTETPSLDERLTGRENLTIYADLYGVPKGDVAQRTSRLLEMFELAERADERVAAYSKGMRQRMALARALLHEPQILFLDEPTSGLDPVATRRVHELIRRLSRDEGRTVFLCTHNLNEAQALCDRLAVMEHGSLVAVGTPAELAEQTAQTRRLELEVEPSQRQQALSLLKTLDAPSLAVIEEREDGTLLIAGAERALVPKLLTLLTGAGVRVYRAAPQEPSLADIYFALHGERLDEVR